MDAFKGKYERTSADQYDEFMKVHTQTFEKITTIINLKLDNETFNIKPTLKIGIWT